MPRRDALLVDDDPEIRGPLAQLLRARGYTVREAKDGRVALDMIADRRPSVVVLDLEMPVMSGWDVLEQMPHAAADAITVVVVSGQQAPLPPAEARVQFLKKPCQVDTLIAAIQAGG